MGQQLKSKEQIAAERVEKDLLVRGGQYMAGRGAPTELPVILKTYDLVAWSCLHLAKFPQSFRFTLHAVPLFAPRFSSSLATIHRVPILAQESVNAHDCDNFS